jgi:hypothetical protein
LPPLNEKQPLDPAALMIKMQFDKKSFASTGSETVHMGCSLLCKPLSNTFFPKNSFHSARPFRIAGVSWYTLK